jgi:hypothetical protein
MKLRIMVVAVLLTAAPSGVQTLVAAPAPPIIDTCAQCAGVIGQVGVFWFAFAQYGEECSNTGPWEGNGDCAQYPVDLLYCADSYGKTEGPFATEQAAQEYADGVCGFGCHPMERTGEEPFQGIAEIDVSSIEDVATAIASSKGRLVINWERGAIQGMGCSEGSIALHVPLSVTTLEGLRRAEWANSKAAAAGEAGGVSD